MLRAGGLPLQLSISPTAITIAPDGSLYVADQNSNRVFTLTGVIQNRVASEDGSEIYEFDGTGRHLRTLDALTGRAIFTFAYSPAGTLVSVTDADGNVTQIERNGAGKVTAIVSPFGQRTTVGLDANGYLATLTNPANETIRVQHDSLGLLRSLTDAKNNPPHVFAYDSIGRLTRDTDPSGGYKSLVRQLSDTGMTATVTTALGRATTHSLFRLSTGDTRRVHTDPAGVVTTTEERANGATAIIAVGWYCLVDNDRAGSAVRHGGADCHAIFGHAAEWLSVCGARLESGDAVESARSDEPRDADRLSDREWSDLAYHLQRGRTHSH